MKNKPGDPLYDEGFVIRPPTKKEKAPVKKKKAPVKKKVVKKK